MNISKFDNPKAEAFVVLASDHCLHSMVPEVEGRTLCGDFSIEETVRDPDDPSTTISCYGCLMHLTLIGRLWKVWGWIE